MVDFRLLPPDFEVTVEELQQTPPRVLRLLIYLLEKLQTLEAANAALKKRVAALDVRLNQNSSNSSQPPSLEPLAKVSLEMIFQKNKLHRCSCAHTNDHFLTDTTKHENACQMNEPQLLSREDDGKRNHTSKEGGHGSET